jgi:hypothetical protein
MRNGEIIVPPGTGDVNDGFRRKRLAIPRHAGASCLDDNIRAACENRDRAQMMQAGDTACCGLRLV